MERDATYYAARRAKFTLRFQDEMAAIFDCKTDAEIGRYYRARVIAERDGHVSDAAKRAAGNGPALSCLVRSGWHIEDDVDTYARNVDRSSKGNKARWKDE